VPGDPDLLELVASDKRIRIVYRDWPVLGPRSLPAGRLAISSAVQGRHATFDTVDAVSLERGSTSHRSVSITERCPVISN